MASRPTQSRRPPLKHRLEPQSKGSPPKHQPESQLRAKWTTPLTRILADLMVDQVHKGNRQNKSFNKKAWKYICDDFYKKTGLNWDVDQLKSRYSALRKQYVVTKSVVDEDDFKWDEPTGVIVASDEAWKKYIKEHHNAEAIRSSGCPIYKQLCTIFSGPTINDNGLIPGPQPLSAFDEEPPSTASEEATADIDYEQNIFQSTPCRDNISSRKRGCRGIDNVIANAISEMAAASKLRATAIKKCNERFSITDCVRALDEMNGVDERHYFAALDLFDNCSTRETFLALKVEKRLAWLQTKLSLLARSQTN